MQLTTTTLEQWLEKNPKCDQVKLYVNTATLSRARMLIDSISAHINSVIDPDIDDMVPFGTGRMECYAEPAE